MPVKYGMPTLIELEDINENIQLCKSLGLDFIELSMNLPEYQPDKIPVQELKKRIKDEAIFFTLHLPENLDITSFNSELRATNLSIVSQAIDVALNLDMPIINMHMNLGIYFTLPNQKIYLFEKYKENYLDMIREFSDFVETRLRGTKLKLCIENTGIYDVDYIKEAITILLDKDEIGLTWDIGHDYTANHVDTAFIEANIDRLTHLHIHDSLGEKNHLTLYSGVDDIDGKLLLAKDKSCRCVIETKTIEALNESVQQLKNKGYVVC